MSVLVINFCKTILKYFSISSFHSADAVLDNRRI